MDILWCPVSLHEPSICYLLYFDYLCVLFTQLAIFSMQKSKRISTAKDTLEILEQGFYEFENKKVSIKEFNEYTLENTELYTPQQLAELSMPAKKVSQTQFLVTNETSISACVKLSGMFPNVLCLNFASAKNPGGGFLGGAEAQEESLARISGLYPSLLKARGYYEHHRALGTTLYSDHMIYSPKVCVIKDEEGDTLPVPYFISFITSPAVNAGAIKNNEPEKLPMLEPVMIERTRKLFKLAAHMNHDHLILGGWGCGVFANDPEMIAGVFHKLLTTEFEGVFKVVHFAVLSKDGKVITPFIKYFGE